ncbi:hypothetical protein FACS189419_03860 [Planctomycetales bacterium]|nr:hypothetical protein FACS189419_03860 [Planctomycetales bacterium]
MNENLYGVKMKLPLSFVFFFFPFAISFADALPPDGLDEDEKAKQVTLYEDGNPVFVYQYDLVQNPNVPKSDLRCLAGCYIHPLYGINGEVLTDNAPKDHYHHHGVFWTYPHVGVHEPDGKITEYDLWQGNKPPLLRQYFVRWVERKENSFTAENGWYVGKPAEGKKIMKEFVKITVHPIQTAATEGKSSPLRSRYIDIELCWFPTDKPVSLRGAEGKSYGGLAVRLKPNKAKGQKEAVHDDINVITVPSGVAKSDLPDTPLPWTDYTSLFDGAEKRSGLAIFVPKDHPGFPQPPTWLTRYYGPLCVGYPGVKAKTYQPGEELKLHYKIWIHDQPVSREQLAKAYEAAL